MVQGTAWTSGEFEHEIRDLWFSFLELSSPSSDSVVAIGVFLLVPEKWWHFLSESKSHDITAGQSAWKRKEKLTVAPSLAASPQTACFFSFSRTFLKIIYIYIIYLLLLPAPVPLLQVFSYFSIVVHSLHLLVWLLFMVESDFQGLPSPAHLTIYYLLREKSPGKCLLPFYTSAACSSWGPIGEFLHLTLRQEIANMSTCKAWGFSWFFNLNEVWRLVMWVSGPEEEAQSGGLTLHCPTNHAQLHCHAGVPPVSQFSLGLSLSLANVVSMLLDRDSDSPAKHNLRLARRSSAITGCAPENQILSSTP